MIQETVTTQEPPASHTPIGPGVVVDEGMKVLFWAPGYGRYLVALVTDVRNDGQQFMVESSSYENTIVRLIDRDTVIAVNDPSEEDP